ncbi:MazG nucleotide pyrophosphohydrolase domain-containing protein [Thalassovita mangrovi]|uniref:Uncharacterized protein n=1 Tax=Thalassovita mangrovi TaxID=2692236 RepID=A0A6L8LFQ9_9RHOB|nr:hypothetical protein [Thalassovita mangrovi]
MHKDLEFLQARAAEVGRIYADSFGIERDGAFYLGKLTEELGEVASAYLKLAGKSRGADGDAEALGRELEDELADLFGFLLIFADWQGVDLAHAFERKWGKYLKERP